MNNGLGEGGLNLYLIECHRFAAMGLVQERSLSSILRSNVITTLINNDVSGKVNAGRVARTLWSECAKDLLRRDPKGRRGRRELVDLRARMPEEHGKDHNSRR